MRIMCTIDFVLISQRETSVGLLGDQLIVDMAPLGGHLHPFWVHLYTCIVLAPNVYHVDIIVTVLFVSTFLEFLFF